MVYAGSPIGAGPRQCIPRLMRASVGCAVHGVAPGTIWYVSDSIGYHCSKRVCYCKWNSSKQR